MWIYIYRILEVKRMNTLLKFRGLKCLVLTWFDFTDRSPFTIKEDESYAISNLELYERDYHVFLLQTNSSYGFYIKFQHIFIDCCDMRVQIGTGNDPFDDASVVRAIEDYTNYVDDVYVRTSQMWLVMAGGKDFNVGHVDIIVTAILVYGEYRHRLITLEFTFLFQSLKTSLHGISCLIEK